LSISETAILLVDCKLGREELIGPKKKNIAGKGGECDKTD
jgi:hypothetical protein